MSFDLVQKWKIGLVHGLYSSVRRVNETFSERNGEWERNLVVT